MIDPVLIRIGPFSITWYALSYVVSLLIGLALIKKLSRKYSIFKMTLIDIDILFNYIVVGIILGGRLGHVIFFDPVYYFYRPIEIFKIWNGGMSFHGGLIGVIFCIHKFSSLKNLFICGSPMSSISFYLIKLFFSQSFIQNSHP